MSEYLTQAYRDISEAVVFFLLYYTQSWIRLCGWRVSAIYLDAKLTFCFLLRGGILAHRECEAAARLLCPPTKSAIACKAHRWVTRMKQQNLKSRGYNTRLVLYPRLLRWWNYFCCLIWVTQRRSLQANFSPVFLWISIYHCITCVRDRRTDWQNYDSQDRARIAAQAVKTAAL